MSAEAERTIGSILREFRLYQRRIVTMLDANNVILQQDSISSTDYETLEASITQLKNDQSRLDHLVSELIDQDPSPVDEKEVADKSAATTLGIVKMVGSIRNAQSQFRMSQPPQPSRYSLFSSTVNQNDNTRNATTTKMPKLRLPTFDGDNRKFLDFKNHFLKVVDENPSLKPIEKMSYLKGSLVGKAEKLLRDMILSDENYSQAWQALLDRYEDNVAIIDSQFETFFAIPKIKSGNDIRDLIDQVDMSLRSLQLIGETPDQWPSIITYFVTTRLDDRTLFDWKKTITDRKKYPTWDTLRSYLKTAAAAFKYADSPSLSSTTLTKKDSSKANETKKTFAVSVKKCFICNQVHLLIECKQFLSETPRQRLDLIRKRNLCVNCFNAGHSAYDCRSRKVCKTCRRKHHTLLHLESSSNRESLSNNSKTESPNQNVQPTSIENKPGNPVTNSTCLKAVSNAAELVILPTAVTRFCADRTIGTLRILIDTCSQVTLVSDALVRRYRLATFPTNNPISLAVSGVKALISKQCNLELQS